MTRSIHLMVLSLLLTASFALPLRAQSVILTNPEGDFQVAGRLISYENFQFTLMTQFGQLTVRDENLICQGSACPDLALRPGYIPPEPELEPEPKSLHIMADR